jgi:hypothetical protein
VRSLRDMTASDEPNFESRHERAVIISGICAPLRKKLARLTRPFPFRQLGIIYKL